MIHAGGSQSKSAAGLDAAAISLLKSEARAIRRHIIEMTAAAGSGHPGGSLSCADILTALYFNVMRVDPQNPSWEERDRFILSKGHAAPVLYATLAERGFFDPGILRDLRKLGCPLQGHPDCRKVPGVEESTGSLGQGLSVGNGLALAARLRGKPYRVYVLLGDGECQEGQVWEAAMSAAHWKLDNLMAFVDYNGLQIDGPTGDVMSLGSLAAKFRAFGWNVLEIDGHDLGQIVDACLSASATRGVPTVAVARTVKGRGVSFMEGQVDWHGKAPSAELAEKAIREIEGGARP
ncbi:MAG: transketolase [Firmicutes bacterium]|nr:transketolase [Bacillota bacterium]